MVERRRTAKRVDPTSKTGAQATDPSRDDPFGRQVFFSSASQAIPGAGSGPFKAECSACGVTSRMTLGDVVRAHFPVWAWIPIMRNSHWMRCPACSERTWMRLRATLRPDT